MAHQDGCHQMNDSVASTCKNSWPHQTVAFYCLVSSFTVSNDSLLVRRGNWVVYYGLYWLERNFAMYILLQVIGKQHVLVEVSAPRCCDHSLYSVFKSDHGMRENYLSSSCQLSSLIRTESSSFRTVGSSSSQCSSIVINGPHEASTWWRIGDLLPVKQAQNPPYIGNGNPFYWWK